MPMVYQTLYVTDSDVGYLDLSMMMGPLYVMTYLYVSVMIYDDLNGVNLNLNML